MNDELSQHVCKSPSKVQQALSASCCHETQHGPEQSKARLHWPPASNSRSHAALDPLCPRGEQGLQAGADLRCLLHKSTSCHKAQESTSPQLKTYFETTLSLKAYLLQCLKQAALLLKKVSLPGSLWCLPRNTQLSEGMEHARVTELVYLSFHQRIF